MTRALPGTAARAPTSTPRVPTARVAVPLQRLRSGADHRFHRRAQRHGAQSRKAPRRQRHDDADVALGVRRFSDTRGWPETVGGWNDCLVLTKGSGCSPASSTTSRISGAATAAATFSATLSGGFSLPKPATIRWQASDRYLLLGTDTDEYTIERVQIQTGTPGRRCSISGCKAPTARRQARRSRPTGASCSCSARGASCASSAMRSARTATSRPT
jgi:hypothetical protein